MQHFFCWPLSGFVQAAWCPQEQPGTASGAALGASWRPSCWHTCATSSTAKQTWWKSCKSCSTKHSLCWSQLVSASAFICHQGISDLVVVLDITHLGYMNKHVTTTLPNERLKAAGIQDSRMEKWNNPVWCFYLQARRQCRTQYLAAPRGLFASQRKRNRGKRHRSPCESLPRRKPRKRSYLVEGRLKESLSFWTRKLPVCYFLLCSGKGRVAHISCEKLEKCYLFLPLKDTERALPNHGEWVRSYGSTRRVLLVGARLDIKRQI